MQKFRKILFWTHLTSGILAGIFIFIMCVTGALLSFESNILNYAESDMSRVELPAENAERLPISALINKIRTAKPNSKPSGVTFQNDKTSAATVSLGRDGQIFVNPYTGEMTGAGATTLRGVFRFIEDAHRCDVPEPAKISCEQPDHPTHDESTHTQNNPGQARLVSIEAG